MLTSPDIDAHAAAIPATSKKVMRDDIGTNSAFYRATFFISLLALPRLSFLRLKARRTPAARRHHLLIFAAHAFEKYASVFLIYRKSYHALSFHSRHFELQRD